MPIKFCSFLCLALSALIALPAAEATEVCTAIAEAGSAKLVLRRGDCARQVTPASTFKIAISLMGYDSGFLQNEHAPTLPFREGYVDWRPNWRHPSDPTRWMKDSVVWYSQQITGSLGKKRFADYVAYLRATPSSKNSLPC